MGREMEREKERRGETGSEEGKHAIRELVSFPDPLCTLPLLATRYGE